MQYILVMKDCRDMLGENYFFASNDSNALIIANQLALQSNCGVIRLIKIVYIPIGISQPQALSTVYAKGVCYYEALVGSKRELVRLAVYDPKFVSPAVPIITVEPFIPTLVGTLLTEEDNITTRFKSAKYMLNQPT